MCQQQQQQQSPASLERELMVTAIFLLYYYNMQHFSLLSVYAGVLKRYTIVSDTSLTSLSIAVKKIRGSNDNRREKKNKTLRRRCDH